MEAAGPACVDDSGLYLPGCFRFRSLFFAVSLQWDPMEIFFFFFHAALDKVFFFHHN